MIVPEGPEKESYAKNQLAIFGNELTTCLLIVSRKPTLNIHNPVTS